MKEEVTGLRTPDSKIFSEEERKKLYDASRYITESYNKIVKSPKQFTADEIMDKILMITEELSKVSYYKSLKNDGENSLIEITQIQDFTKAINSGEINKVIEIRFYTDNKAKTLKIKGQINIFEILEFIHSLDGPKRDIKTRGGQKNPIRERIIRDFARDIYIWYRKYFETDEQVYYFISALLEIPEGKKNTPDTIKHRIHK